MTLTPPCGGPRLCAGVQPDGGSGRSRGREATPPGVDSVERLLALMDTAYAWAMAQPLPLQLVLGLGLLAVLYFLYVLVSITAAALYATFFKS